MNYELWYSIRTDSVQMDRILWDVEERHLRPRSRKVGREGFPEDLPSERRFKTWSAVIRVSKRMRHIGGLSRRKEQQMQGTEGGKAEWAERVVEGNKKMLVENRLWENLESNFYCLLHVEEYIYTKVMPATDDGSVIMCRSTSTHIPHKTSHYAYIRWVKNNQQKLF